MSETWTSARILSWIEGYLAEKGDENPRVSARWLVSDALQVEPLELYTDPDRPLSDDERALLRNNTARRAAGEPLQYITGSTGFRFLTLAVEPGVLIPRPETEVLVSEALAQVERSFPALFDGMLPQPPVRVVDLCTGSGNIACSIASERAGALVVATDISEEAVELARRNVNDLGLQHRVRVCCCDLADAVPESWQGRVHLLVSNPPYIPTDVYGQLEHEVAAFEPRLALDGGPDGLDVFRRIVPAAKRFLCPGGVLAVELHETCLEQAAEFAGEVGFEGVRIARDLAGRSRVLVALRRDGA